MIAILGDLEGHKNAEEIYGKAAELGYMTHAIKEQFVKNFAALFPRFSNQDMRELVTFDAGLAAMQMMLAAKAKGYSFIYCTKK